MLAACGLPLASVADEGGIGLPAKIDGERYAGEAVPFAAELSVGDEGCVYLDFGEGRMLAIWPTGSDLSDPVRLPDGTEARAGDIVEGVGTLVAFGALPGGVDGYWSHVAGFCRGDVPRALVVDQVNAVR